MLEDGSHKAIYLTGIAEEHLALTVLDVLLDVERYGLGNAEILHVLRDINPHLSAQLEEMINRMTGCEYYSGVIKYIDMLLSELLCGERLNTDKRFEHELYAIFISQIKIGRFACCRLRLGYQDLLNFQGCKV